MSEKLGFKVGFIRFLGVLLTGCAAIFAVSMGILAITVDAKLSDRVFSGAIAVVLGFLAKILSKLIKYKTKNIASPTKVTVIKPPVSKTDIPPNVAQERKIDYTPLEKLFDEIQNETDNNYLPFDPHITVGIDYLDNEGNKSRREVDIYYIAQSDYANDEYYFKGYCHLRNEDRSFKATRVTKTFANGREVELISHIVDTYRNSDKYTARVMALKVERLINSDNEPGISARILTYIARIDGTFTRKEKVTIAQFLQTIANVDDDIEIENYIDGLGELKPTTPEYKTIIKRSYISNALIEKAKELIGKDPLRQGAFEILLKEYEKHNKQNQN